MRDVHRQLQDIRDSPVVGQRQTPPCPSTSNSSRLRRSDRFHNGRRRTSKENHEVTAGLILHHIIYRVKLTGKFVTGDLSLSLPSGRGPTRPGFVQKIVWYTQLFLG
ncbi:hypothetical protein KC337_g17 [Hortaea werneckii]|nr:hypothetical protein KC337_g17 [Hortaea werneckii]